MNKKTIFIVGLIVISIILIVIGISSINNKDEEDEDIKINIQYDIDAMKLVRDYDTYYTLEKIVKGIVENIYNENYNNILDTIDFKVYDDSYYNRVLNDLKTFSNRMNKIGFDIENESKILYEVYEASENEYNCLFEVFNTIHYVLICLDEEELTYVIKDIKIMEGE